MTLEQSSKNKLILEPFLHFENDRIYNPITDKTIQQQHPHYESIINCRRLGVDHINNDLIIQLLDNDWIVKDKGNLLSRFLLKVVSLEGNTHCNQRCFFCPVSENPKPIHTMPLDQYEEIVQQLAQYKDTIEGLFMINYNEPTVDKFFIERIEILNRYDLPICINTNATGLNKKKVDQIMELGQLRFLSINLSTIDPAKYDKDRKWKNLRLILNNLEYLKNIPLAEEMVIAVLGEKDEEHELNFKRIYEAFEDSYFDIKSFPIMDRAGHLNVGDKIDNTTNQLAGCDNLGSRPIQHLHINSFGECVLCCEDYFEKYKMGDLKRETVHEVLTGKKAQYLRGLTYGLIQSPDNYICKKCIFALTCKSSQINHG